MWVVLSSIFLMLTDYELILQPVSPTDQSPQWVLSYSSFDIASWTMKHRPSLIALLKAIQLFEQWDDYCGDLDPRLTPLPFKTYWG